ncbi:type III polyketide synthase [Streptacidiphilus sp. EB103A]|uniref:type III polyketide synthase n=1 Tax=Streptacidiphilus sp. EB103A TaxID=3156275 RepID=UPI003511F285
MSRPAVVFPPYEVELDQILADIQTHHADHAELRRILRIVGRTGVRSRRFTRPLDEVGRRESIEPRNRRTFADVCALGAEAARAVLAEQGVEPTQVDCVVTSHSTGVAIPGLDVHLFNALGLRPDVRRIPMTQLGCTGGALALVRAAEQVRARPGSRVLVVVAEALSTVYQHSDDSIEAMIYKVLFGDSGGAVLVSDAPLGTGLVVEDTWEFTLRNTTERQRLRLDDLGQHFDSTADALKSMGELVSPLLDWYRRSAGQDTPDFWVAHTGGPRILSDLEDGVGCDRKLLQHSWESLRERGNLGGVAVLDVLDRLYATPPGPGASGVLIGLGPGFAAAACRAVWHIG